MYNYANSCKNIHTIDPILFIWSDLHQYGFKEKSNINNVLFKTSHKVLDPYLIP